MTGFQTHFHLSFDCNHHRSHCIITLFYLKASTRLDSTRFNHIHSQTVSKREWAKWCNSLYNVSVTAFDKRNRLEYLLCAHWSRGGGVSTNVFGLYCWCTNTTKHIANIIISYCSVIFDAMQPETFHILIIRSV